MTPRRTTQSFTRHSVWLYQESLQASTSAWTSTSSRGAYLASRLIEYGAWLPIWPPCLGGFDLRDELLDLSRENSCVHPSGEVTASQRRAHRRRRLSENGVNVPRRNDAVMGEGDAVYRLAASAECCANVDVQNSARTTRKRVCGYSSEGLRLRQAQRVVT